MKKPEFGKAFTKLVNFPFKLLGWLLQQLVVWTLRLGVIISALVVVLILFTSIWLGFFIHRNLDRPMTYTPVPINQQPPEGLTFRQLYQGVKDCYKNKFKDHNSPIIRKYSFYINEIFLLPFPIYQIPRDAWVLTHPDSFLKDKIPPKDYQRFVEPLEGKFDIGLKDFPEAMWLQIEASYWYWEHNLFLESYALRSE